MKNIKRKFFIEKKIYKDLIIYPPILYFIPKVGELIYDYANNFPYSNLSGDLLFYIFVSLIFSSPFIFWRYKSIKEHKKNNRIKVFISYSSNDQSMVESIKNKLERESDFTFWWQKDLLPGQDYQDEIKNNIADSNIVLIMYSKNFENSKDINDWELPFIEEVEKNNNDITILPCVIGEYEKEIPFSNKYQVVPSRSNGFHRMIQSQFNKEVVHLSEVMNYQVNLKFNNRKKFKDSNLFKRLIIFYSLFLFFTSANYLLGDNQRDNMIDTAAYFLTTSFKIDDDFISFQQFATYDNFEDFSEFDLIEHRNNLNYAHLLNAFISYRSYLDYEEEWIALLEEGMLVKRSYESYLFSIEYGQENLEYKKYWETGIDQFLNQYCKILTLYTSRQNFDFADTYFSNSEYEEICISIDS